MASDKTIHRYVVPLDDKPHTIELTAWPADHFEAVLPENGTGAYVEFWAEHILREDELDASFKLKLQAYGTGHRIPREAIYLGTCTRVNGLVFHLYMLDEDE